MGSMKDLLGDTPYAYPYRPGWKEPTTSKDAGDRFKSAASVLKERVYAAFVAAGMPGLTADEAAAKVDSTVLAVRPRVTELGKEIPPRLVKTKMRRKNSSGMSATVWRAAIF